MGVLVEVTGWANFAVAAVGVAGALAGLLFVGLSLNLDFVLAAGHLPARAGTALATLLSVAVLNLCVLIPDQSSSALAIEAALLAAVLAALALVTFRVTLRRRGPDDPLTWAVQPLILNLVTPVAALWLALKLFTGGGAGLIALPTICGLIAAVWEAWVLLIEIRR